MNGYSTLQPHMRVFSAMIGIEARLRFEPPLHMTHVDASMQPLTPDWYVQLCFTS